MGSKESDGIQLLRLAIQDRDDTITLALKQSRDGYAKGYYAGSNRATNTIRWFVEERERLKVLVRSLGGTP